MKDLCDAFVCFLSLLCEGFLAPPARALALERQGLGCAVHLPQGARPMTAPPRSAPELKTWAEEQGQGQFFINLKRL